MQLSGDITEQKGGRFAPPLSVPQLKEALEKGAYDPRIRGIHLKIGAVSAGWAKLQVQLHQECINCAQCVSKLYVHLHDLQSAVLQVSKAVLLSGSIQCMTHSTVANCLHLL